MVDKDTIEAFNFIKENINFFAAPYLDSSFQKWASQKENIGSITLLTNTLLPTLKEEFDGFSHATFISACVGDRKDPNNPNLKANSEFVKNMKLLSLLQNSPSLTKNILQLKDNFAVINTIDNWYMDNPFIRKKDTFSDFSLHYESYINFQTKFNFRVKNLNNKKAMLVEKAKDLKKDGYEEASSQLFSIISCIEKEKVILENKVDAYEGLTAADTSTFKNNTFEVVRTNISALKEHRGLKQDFIYLLAAICDLITAGLTLLIPIEKFKVETNTVKEVNKLKEDIEEFECLTSTSSHQLS